MTTDPVAIARDLIRRRSVTPDEGGALDYLQEALGRAGFAAHRATFAEPGTAPVDNLYARIGIERPNLMFAGHTDVVPPGDESGLEASAVCRRDCRRRALWPRRRRHEGRHRVLCRRGPRPSQCQRRQADKGSLSFLITGDEEGVAVNGTVKLLQWAAARGETFDNCIVGEPSSSRGSWRYHQGRPARLAQRHAHCHRAPGPRRLSAIAPTTRSAAWPALIDRPVSGPLDEGSAHFDPSNLEFTTVDVGNRTVNLIPGEARARFNIRYNDRHSAIALKTLIERRAQAAAGGRVRFPWSGSPRMPMCFSPSPAHSPSLLLPPSPRLPGASRSSRPPAAPRTPASSRTTARCSSLGSSDGPRTRSTNARRLKSSLR